MSKPIEITADIDENGKVHLHIDGTEGDECLDVLKVIERIAGMECLSTERTNQEGDKRKRLRRNDKLKTGK